MERSPELEYLTRTLYDAVSKGDISFFERHLSRRQSCVVIGTAPDEWWDEYGSALASIREQMKAVGDAAELAPGDVRAYRHGDVGWVADRPMFRLGKIERTCRHTSVFVRENGEWRIVQHHFSVGVANEDVFGEEAAKLGEAGRRDASAHLGGDVSRLEFDVFGRRVLVERTDTGWLALYRGSEGKHRVARDLPIPRDATEAELEGYLADLCHEWATPEKTTVRRLT